MKIKELFKIISGYVWKRKKVKTYDVSNISISINGIEIKGFDPDETIILNSSRQKDESA